MHGFMNVKKKKNHRYDLTRKKFLNKYYLQNIKGTIKLKRMRWVGHVKRIKNVKQA
jgi:hypothetical protein